MEQYLHLQLVLYYKRKLQIEMRLCTAITLLLHHRVLLNLKNHPTPAQTFHKVLRNLPDQKN